MDRATFNIYGLGVVVRSAREAFVEDLTRDFSYFLAPAGSDAVTVELAAEGELPPPRPRLKAALQTPRNTVYRDGELTYLDYFGRAWALCDENARTCRIFCADRDLAHEIAYLTVLSRAGQHLDRIGLHRVHALGLEAGGRAVLLLLPMGGGKTTLALSVLASGCARLLSEDTPLMARDGTIHPFPLRIGVRAGQEPAGVPPERRRTVARMEFGPKTLIDVEHFRGQIGGACPVGSVLIGEKWLSGPSAVRPMPRRRALPAFIKCAVVGLGVYQGVEFVLERSPWELVGKAGLAMRRLRASLAVVRRAEVYRLVMGPDPAETADVLRAFLRSREGG
jgi:hypothetical protein